MVIKAETLVSKPFRPWVQMKTMPGGLVIRVQAGIQGLAEPSWMPAFGHDGPASIAGLEAFSGRESAFAEQRETQRRLSR